MRPVSVCALAAACLFILPAVDRASAAPWARSSAHVSHGRRFVAAHPLFRRGTVHRHARFHRFRHFDRFGGGWPGFGNWGYAPFAPAFAGNAEGAPALDALPSIAQVPVLVGIREAPAAQPAIIVVGRNGARVHRSKARAAQYAAAGPLIIQVVPARR